MDTATKPPLELVGQDGNAFAVLGAAKVAARKAGWSSARWAAVAKEAMSGDYNHLLATIAEHFEVS